MEMTVPLSQALRKDVARLTDELALLRIAHDRADGALADAATVPTGDLERGVRALTAERDGLRDELQVADQIGDSFWAALKPRLPEAIYVSDPGRHFTELLDAAEANVKALAAALEHALASEDPDEWEAEAHAALDRDGVRRGRGEGTR